MKSGVFSKRAVSGQCLKRHHHQNANQSSGAAALTKNKRRLVLVLMSVFFINCGDPPPLYHGEVILEWCLIQFSILQKNLYLKSMVYIFSRIVLNLFQGLIYQNEPFYTGCLVSLHSFFAFYSLKHLLRFEFCFPSF